MQTPVHIFVYGTLASHFDNPYAKRLRKETTFVSEAAAPGYLYLVEEDFWYPAAVFDPASSQRIKGEIYLCEDEQRLNGLVNMLDAYEGYYPGNEAESLYIRKEVIARTSQGADKSCVSYHYQYPVDQLLTIESGSFISYYRQYGGGGN